MPTLKKTTLPLPRTITEELIERRREAQAEFDLWAADLVKPTRAAPTLSSTRTERAFDLAALVQTIDVVLKSCEDENWEAMLNALCARVQEDARNLHHSSSWAANEVRLSSLRAKAQVAQMIEFHLKH